MVDPDTDIAVSCLESFFPEISGRGRHSHLYRELPLDASCLRGRHSWPTEEAMEAGE